MSIYSIQHSYTQGFAHNVGDTVYHPLCGDSYPTTTEAYTEFVARVAWTLSDMFVSVIENSITASTIMRSRVNAANGNLSVTIPASTLGEFEDTTNTDSISSGDTVDWQIVVGSTGTLIGPHVNRALIEDTAGDVAPYCVGAQVASMPRNVTRYEGVAGAMFLAIQPLEIQFRHQTAFTSSDLRVFASANGISDPSTVTAEPDQMTGNQTVTIPASTTGAFADTVNTDSIAANQFMRWNFDAGMGAHNDSNLFIQTVESHADSPTRASMASKDNQFVAAGVTEEAAIEGDFRVISRTETTIDVSLGLAYDAANLYVQVNTNDADASTIVVLRINGADGTVTVTIGTLATGVFEDTTNSDAISATDKVNFRWDATAVGSGLARSKRQGLELTETPSGVEGPEVIHFRSLTAFARP